MKLVLTAYGEKHAHLLERCRNSVPVTHLTMFDEGNGKGWAMTELFKMVSDEDECYLLDADDMAFANWFERSLGEHDLVYGDCMNSGRGVYRSRPFDYELLKKINYIPYSTVLVRGSVIKNKVYPDIKHVGDWIFWHQLGTKKFHYESGVVSWRDTTTSYYDNHVPIIGKLKRLHRNHKAKNIIWKLTHTQEK